MTEREWLSDAVAEEEWVRCRSMEGMPYNLDYCFDRCGVLFASACCRSVWHHLPAEPGRAAVLTAERYAVGEATKEELEAAEQRAYETATAMDGTLPIHPWASPAWHAMWAAGSFTGALSGRRPMSGAAYHARYAIAWAIPSPEHREEREKLIKAEAIRQWGLVLDIFGNPSHPPVLDPAWHTPEVVMLAHAAWEHRVAPDPNRPGWLVLDSERLLILANALANVGCNNADCLGHLRSPAPHVRGCHVLDALLGRW